MAGSAACICCGGSAQVAHFEGLLRCVDCSHVWAGLRLSGEELRALYAENYFKGEEYLDYEREEPALRKNFRRTLRSIRRAAPEAKRLWEVGTAYGYFLDEAARHYEVAGCDIAEAAALKAVARFGLDVRVMDYPGKELDAPWDVVCLWDTLEHLAAPERYLAKAHDELRPGGLLALSTGDIGAWTARLRGRRWRLIHPPTHLHYFTARSMRTLLARLGFEVLSLRHRGFWRTADAVAYQMLAHGRGGMGPRIYASLRSAGLLRFSFPMNTLDLMTVLAVKR